MVFTLVLGAQRCEPQLHTASCWGFLPSLPHALARVQVVPGGRLSGYLHLSP